MKADALRRAMARVLRPLVGVLIARGIGFPALSEMLKRIYVEVAERRFALDGRRVTDSRVSLLTGLQRKDVRQQRAALAEGEESVDDVAGPLPRILARWCAGPPYADRRGQPRPLPRAGDAKPSFETLAAGVSRDMHPRTLLDELVRLRLATHDQAGDQVALTGAAFLPSRDDAAMAGYLGANLGDHAEAAVENMLAAPETGPFFERAVHYNRLTPASLDELERLARDLQTEALEKLNTEAMALQDRDDGTADATGRFRCGAYVFRAEEAER